MPERIYRLRRFLEDTPKQVGNAQLRVVPSPYDPRDYKYTTLKPTVPLEQLPDETFNRAHIPLVVDQGKFGTCTAVSSVNGFKAYEEITQGDYPSAGLSPAFVYDVSKNIDGAPDEAGTYLRVTMKVLQQYGVCPESCYPYSTLTSDTYRPMPPAAAFDAAAQFRISTYAQIASLTDNDRSNLVETIYNALVNEGPVEAALIVTESFMDVKGPDYIIPKPAGKILGAHAVRIVDACKKRQAFLLPNTWGTCWGDNGAAWLPWSWLTEQFDPVGDGRHGTWFFMECWTATDVVIPRTAKRIELCIGRQTANVDGADVLLDQPAIVDPHTNRTLIPVRFVAGNMGYLVAYNQTENKVVLTQPN
jgi:C1A family cysteine protease